MWTALANGCRFVIEVLARRGAQSLPFILRGAGKSRWQLITKLL